jgi:hypothetical protein
MSYKQYYGKKSDVMIKVPPSVKKYADEAFKLRDIGFKGATETGWKRAKQLSTKNEIPIQDFRYVRNWYARHYYTSYPGYQDWVDAGKPKDSHWFRKRAIISWLTWGGTAGLNWVNSSRNLSILNNYFGTDYGKI